LRQQRSGQDALLRGRQMSMTEQRFLNRCKAKKQFLFGFLTRSATYRLTFSAIFAAPFREVSEWSKEHAWKVCMGQKLIVGSNPILSAKNAPGIELGAFLCFGGTL
jgi:hypothetical protein